MNIKLIIAILFCSLSMKLQAQNPVCRTINTSNGLPSNTTYNIYQDSVGFIWMAHDKGLSRYDGKQFVHYSPKGQQGKSLSNILKIKNEIWCQDFSGNFYHTQQGQLVQEKRIKSKGNYINAQKIKNNILTVVNYDSLRSFNVSNGIARTFANISFVQNANASDANKVYYLGKNQLFSFDGTIQRTERTFEPAIDNIFYLIKSSKKFFLITKGNYPYVYKLEGNKASPLNYLKPGKLIQGAFANKDEVWICTTTGAYCFDLDFKPKFSGKCFFEGNSISNVLKDREGNYWFCTLNNGIFFVTDIDVNIFTFEKEMVTSIGNYAGQDELLLGTSKNAIFSFNTKSFHQKLINRENANHEVLNIMYDSVNRNIIFCSDKIIFLHDGKKQREYPIAGKAFSPLNKDLTAIAYSSGISLISNANITPPIPLWLEIPNMTWEGFHYKIEVGASRGRDVLYDQKRQTLYGATANGLLFFNPTEKGEILFENKKIFASNLAQCGDHIIAATYTDGLFQIDGKNVVQLNKRNPKISNTIYKLKCDGDWIWMVGESFINRYNIKSNELIEYDYSDGLPKAEIKDIFIKNEHLYVATTEGLIRFETTKNNLNKIAPTVVLNEVKINDQSVDLSSKNVFNYKENNLRIYYSVLAFRGIESIKVQYRINNAAWQNTDSKSNQIILSSLSPDDYKIEIRAINNEGIISPQSQIINFSIEAPLYKKPLFGLAIAALLFALMYLYFKNRLKNERKNNKHREDKNKLEQELKQSMLSSIKSQMNPHFLFNALNTIQSYIYTNDKENASQYLGKFSELTRMILDMSNKEIVSLAEEIKSLKLYVELEQLRFEDKLVYEFVIDENLSLDMSFIPSMLIQPYVENAIKHGLLHQKSPWRLTVTFTEKDNGVDVIVDDNGVGRKRSAELNRQKNKKQHESFATSANQKRLEILNKDVNNAISIKIIDKEDNFGNAVGTCIQLHIPFAHKK